MNPDTLVYVTCGNNICECEPRHINAVMRDFERVRKDISRIRWSWTKPHDFTDRNWWSYWEYDEEGRCLRPRK